MKQFRDERSALPLRLLPLAQIKAAGRYCDYCGDRLPSETSTSRKTTGFEAAVVLLL